MIKVEEMRKHLNENEKLNQQKNQLPDSPPNVLKSIVYENSIDEQDYEYDEDQFKLFSLSLYNNKAKMKSHEPSQIKNDSLISHDLQQKKLSLPEAQRFFVKQNILNSQFKKSGKPIHIGKKIIVETVQRQKQIIKVQNQSPEAYNRSNKIKLPDIIQQQPLKNTFQIIQNSNSLKNQNCVNTNIGLKQIVPPNATGDGNKDIDLNRRSSKEYTEKQIMQNTAKFGGFFINQHGSPSPGKEECIPKGKPVAELSPTKINLDYSKTDAAHSLKQEDILQNILDEDCQQVIKFTFQQQQLPQRPQSPNQQRSKSPQHLLRKFDALIQKQQLQSPQQQQQQQQMPQFCQSFRPRDKSPSPNRIKVLPIKKDGVILDVYNIKQKTSRSPSPVAKDQENL